MPLMIELVLVIWDPLTRERGRNQTLTDREQRYKSSKRNPSWDIKQPENQHQKIYCNRGGDCEGGEGKLDWGVVENPESYESIVQSQYRS